MSKYKLLAIIGFTVHTLLTVPSVLATGIGDCTIRLNSIDNVAYGGGYVNNLEIWIMNDTPLYGLSMGFRI